jgi:membrane protein implicated in regulation of membrane protease activity
MSWLLSLYIGATVFGVGVTFLDLLGVLGGDQSDDADGGDDFGADADSDLDISADAGGEASGDSDADADADAQADDHHSAVLGHDRRSPGDALLAFFSLLRNLIYFCLGFGPVGWFALATGESLGATLAWSVGVGIVVLTGARILRRVLRSELTSSIRESDLLMERGTVTVTIMPGQLGRVRVKLGSAYIDRSARAENAEKKLGSGTAIQVVNLDADGVIVEEVV